MNPEKFLQPSVNNKLLNLPVLEKNLPFKEKIDQLFKDKVLFENEEGKKYILQTLSRIAVIANINGVKIPFYQSSSGTGGKTDGGWYPFFGNKGAWLIKGDIEKMNRGYDIPEIKEMMEYLDQTLPEYLYLNLLTEEQKKVFADPVWKSKFSKNEQIKNANKDFILNPDEAGEYMAKVLNYDMKDAPEDSSSTQNPEFIKKILDSIKQKLDIVKKF